jgi:hypothetical protein
MSQAWEHIDIRPGALVAKHVQVYRWPPGGTGGAPDDAIAGVLIDIDLAEEIAALLPARIAG